MNSSCSIPLCRNLLHIMNRFFKTCSSGLIIVSSRESKFLMKSLKPVVLRISVTRENSWWIHRPDSSIFYSPGELKSHITQVAPGACHYNSFLCKTSASRIPQGKGTDFPKSVVFFPRCFKYINLGFKSSFPQKKQGQVLVFFWPGLQCFLSVTETSRGHVSGSETDLSCVFSVQVGGPSLLGNTAL